MKVVFADSFYFFALLNPSDKDHRQAEDFARGWTGRMVTTAWVLTELADGLCKPPFRDRAGSFIERIQGESAVRIIRFDEDVYTAAWKMYRSRADKDWSLTDCTSFVVMQREGLSEALTGDRHFEQTGFTLLFP